MLITLHNLLVALVSATTDLHCVGEWCPSFTQEGIHCEKKPYFNAKSLQECQNACVFDVTCVWVDWKGEMEHQNCALVKGNPLTNCTGTHFWRYLPTLPTTYDFAPEDLQVWDTERLVTAAECRYNVNLAEYQFDQKFVGKWSDSSGSTQTIVPVGLWPHPQAVNVRLAYVLEEANGNVELWYLNGGSLDPTTDTAIHMAKDGQIYTASKQGFFLDSGHCMAMRQRQRPPLAHAMLNDPNSLLQPECSVGLSLQTGKKGPWVMRKPSSTRLFCLQKPDFDHPNADHTISVLSQHTDDEAGSDCDQNWQLLAAGGATGDQAEPVAEPVGLCEWYKYTPSVDGLSLEPTAPPSKCRGLEGDWNIPYYFTGTEVWVGTIRLSGTSGTVDMGVPGLVYHFAVSENSCEIHFCVTPNVQPESVACTVPGNFLSGHLNAAGDIIWDQDNYPRWTRNSPPGPIGCPNMPFYACVKEGGTNGPLNCAQAPDPSMCTAVTVDGTPPFCGKDDNCKWCDTTSGILQCATLDNTGIVV